MAGQLSSFGRQVFPVTDSTPVTKDGLTFGYSIVNEQEKEVSKGNASRYKVKFFITNTSDQAKILLRPQGSGLLVSTTSYYLVQFRCLNATGARLTNKEMSLQAKPCVIEAVIEDKDCSSDKTIQKERPANIGFWLRPNETIQGSCIFIVPLNERPNITATLFPMNNNTLVGTFSLGPTSNLAAQFQGFIRIRNLAANNYLNNQRGPVACSTISYDWFSAQWELLPVEGTRYYLIRNRQSNRFFSIDNNAMLSDNSETANARWLIEETGMRNTYTIKNASTNAKLVLQNDLLTTTDAFTTQPNMQWIIEQ
ncbi:hypothetical protein A3860_08630 [Niastella vici]|uniref:Ricin B lectin domain-containing protein n=2 Tax=Niastella vici TaxID=1703345 RepID=A0A1V9FHD5_9BACT|nr:hypothetical protein A3860_08630 [Niastella vici]